MLDIVLLILRVFLGIAFIVHGLPKVKDPENTKKYLHSVGIPIPSVNAYLLAATEFVGGILVLLGLFAQIVASLQAFAMLVAIGVHLKSGDKFKGGWEIAAAYLMIAITIALLGAGRYSLGSYFSLPW